MHRPRAKGSLLLSAILIPFLILHFGLFDVSPMNPVGVKFLQEVWMVITLAFTAFLILGTPHGRKSEYNVILFFCLVMVGLFIVLPAIFSYLVYKQPIVYGLIEERRVLGCFSAILLLWMAQRMTAKQLERVILLVGLIAVVISWLCFKELLPDLRVKDGSEDISRPGRASVGHEALILSFCLCIYYWHKGKSPIDGTARTRMIYIPLALLFFATLVFVTQTRQLLLMCLVFAILCLKGRSIKFVLIGALAVLPLVINPHLLDSIGVSLDFYMRSLEDGPTDNIREHTVSQIFAHLDNMNWLPSGSLSLMWNEGFAPHFGVYFFLSDVGVIGTLFRFGFLSVFVIPFGLYMYYRTAKKLNRDMDFTLIFFVAWLVLWPLQGLFEYLQGMTAMLFVFQGLKTFHRARPPQPQRVDDRPSAHANFSYNPQLI